MDTFTASAMESAALPVIDVSGLSSSKEGERRAVAEAIGKAATESGFFYVANHGVPEGLVDAVFAETRKFFDQPLEAKERIAMTHSFCNRGWEPLKTQSLDVTAPPDVKESAYIGRELPLDHPWVEARRFNHGPNQWPMDMPGFKPTMNAYYAAMLDLSERIMRGIALSLGLAEDHFAFFMREPMATLRLLHYPPQPADALDRQTGAGAHTDYGATTLLLQDENGGLQVKAADESWIHATPIPGTFVFNLGDMIARWTNDRYRSTVHRVVNLSGKERYSIPFFVAGNPDAVIECLPGCLAAGESPKYEPTTAEGHMREQYGRSYGAAKKAAGQARA